MRETGQNALTLILQRESQREGMCGEREWKKESADLKLQVREWRSAFRCEDLGGVVRDRSWQQIRCRSLRAAVQAQVSSDVKAGAGWCCI